MNNYRSFWIPLSALCALLVIGSQASAQTNTFPSSGNAGIGTTSPGVALELAQDSAIRVGAATLSSGAGGSYAHLATQAWYNGSAWQSNGNPGGLYQISDQNHRFYKHDGAGGFTALMIVDANGNLTVAGNIAAKYQDVAEWVPTSRSMAAGTVVVLDPVRDNNVIPSSEAYDTRVAGVVSDTPGIVLGEASEGKVKVATTGRVKVRVDATRVPIQRGDLLVTSDREGIAMRSEALDIGGARFHRPGTMIGKALEPLNEGEGEILVLLSLQ